MERKYSTIDIHELKDKYASELNNQLFKIVIVGDSGVGKSNILARYVQDEFYKESKSTVGVELSTKIYKINESIIKVNIWDTAGQERYKSITASYYKGARGAMIVYDITKRDSFESVKKWYNDIKSMGDNSIIVLLVGNKCDLNLLRQVEYSEGVERARKLSIPFIEASALNSSNIEEAFKQLILEIYLNKTKVLTISNGDTAFKKKKGDEIIVEGKTLKLFNNNTIKNEEKYKNNNNKDKYNCNC